MVSFWTAVWLRCSVVFSKLVKFKYGFLKIREYCYILLCSLLGETSGNAPLLHHVTLRVCISCFSTHRPPQHLSHPSDNDQKSTSFPIFMNRSGQHKVFSADRYILILCVKDPSLFYECNPSQDYPQQKCWHVDTFIVESWHVLSSLQVLYGQRCLSRFIVCNHERCLFYISEFNDPVWWNQPFEKTCLPNLMIYLC